MLWEYLLDGIKGVWSSGHTKAIVVTTNHVVVFLVFTECRQQTLKCLCFFQLAVVTQVSVDEDVWNSAAFYFCEHAGHHDFGPWCGVDGLAGHANVDVIGDGYGLNVFAGWSFDC